MYPCRRRWFIPRVMIKTLKVMSVNLLYKDLFMLISNFKSGSFHTFPPSWLLFYFYIITTFSSFLVRNFNIYTLWQCWQIYRVHGLFKVKLYCIQISRPMRKTVLYVSLAYIQLGWFYRCSLWVSINQTYVH